MCDAASSGDARRVCQSITDLYRDPELHAVIRGGLGAALQLSQLTTNLVASVGAGRYSGGGTRIVGRWYLDVRAELSAAVTIF